MQHFLQQMIQTLLKISSRTIRPHADLHRTWKFQVFTADFYGKSDKFTIDL